MMVKKKSNMVDLLLVIIILSAIFFGGYYYYVNVYHSDENLIREAQEVCQSRPNFSVVIGNDKNDPNEKLLDYFTETEHFWIKTCAEVSSVGDDMTFQKIIKNDNDNYVWVVNALNTVKLHREKHDN